MLAMSVMMLLFWGLLIALVVWLVRSSRPGGRHADHPSDHPASDPAQRADAVLTERFARGEVDEDEFTKRRQVLHSTGRHP